MMANQTNPGSKIVSKCAPISESVPGNQVKSTEALISGECAKFVSKMAKYQGDDPLSEWVKHITWLESFPEEPFIDKLLQKGLADCCHQLLLAGKETKRYYNDERFIQVLVKLAQFSPPLQIYEYMHVRQVGLLCPLFYIEWSNEAELAKGFEEADKILCKGLKACISSENELSKLMEARKALNVRFKQPDPLVKEMSVTLQMSKPSSLAVSKTVASPDIPSLGSNTLQVGQLVKGNNSVDNSPASGCGDVSSKLMESTSSEPSSVKLETFQHKKKPRDSLFMKRYDKLHLPREDVFINSKITELIQPVKSRPSEGIGLSKMTDEEVQSVNDFKSVKSGIPEIIKECLIWDPERVGNVSIEEALVDRRRKTIQNAVVDNACDMKNTLDQRERNLVEAQNRVNLLEASAEERFRLVEEKIRFVENQFLIAELKTREADEKAKSLDDQCIAFRKEREAAETVVETAKSTARAANRIMQELAVCFESLLKDLSVNERPIDAIITFTQTLHDKLLPLEKSFVGSTRNEILQVLGSRCEKVLEVARDHRSRVVVRTARGGRPRNNESAFADESDLNSRDNTRRSDTRDSTRRSDTKSSLPASAVSLSEQSNPCIKAMWNQTSIHEASRFRASSDDGYISEKKVAPVSEIDLPIRQSLTTRSIAVPLRTDAVHDPENIPVCQPLVGNGCAFQIFADESTAEPYLPHFTRKDDLLEEIVKDENDDSENTPPPDSLEVIKEARRISGVLNESAEHPGISPEVLCEKDFIEVPASESDTSSVDSDLEHGPITSHPNLTQPVTKTCRRSVAFAEIQDDFEPVSRRKSFGLSDQTLPLISQSEFYRHIDTAQYMASTPLVSATTEVARRPERQSRLSYIPPNSKLLSPINESREKSSSSSSGVSTWIKSKKSLGTYSPVKEHEEPTLVDPYNADLLASFKQRLQESLFSDSLVKYLPDSCLKEIEIQATQLKLQNHRCNLDELLGKGSFSTVYSARSTTDQNLAWAVKVQPNDGWWNFYIHSETIRRLRTLPDAEQYSSFIMPLVEYQEAKDGGSYTVMPLSEQGTLTKLAAAYQRTSDKVMPEALALKFSADVIHAVEGMHLSNLIHGDVKASNFFLQNLSRLNDAKLAKQFTAVPGVLLSDFNCGIDLTLFDETVVFATLRKGKATAGQEIISSTPWTFQVDYIGILDVMHLLLFGEPLKLVRENDIWRPSKVFKPNWHPVWQASFLKLLNIPCADQTPETLTGIRRSFEEAADCRLQSTDLTRLLRQMRVNFFITRKNFLR